MGIVLRAWKAQLENFKFDQPPTIHGGNTVTEIKLRAGEAREMAARVRSDARRAEEDMNSLRTYLGNLSSSFTGQTAIAFEKAFNEWKAGADNMLRGLDGLGDFLHNAATKIEEVDTQIASQLRG